MSQNILVFDIETSNTFADLKDRSKITDLNMSVIGVYDYRTDEYAIFEATDLGALIERLQEKPLLVGFNSRRFDVPILQKYIPFPIQKFPQLDMLEIVHKTLGHRISLDNIAKGTLNSSKSGNGLDAVRYFQEGNMDALKKYCLDDVRITKDVYEYGATNNELIFVDKFKGGNRVVKVDWEIAHPKENDEMDLQGSLF